MAYTLQVGREAMGERLAFVVTSAGQLVEKLEAWLAGEQNITDCIAVKETKQRDVVGVRHRRRSAADRPLAHGRKLSRLLDLWVTGLELDWTRLYGETKPVRLSLPTYPFARERHWIDITPGKQSAAISASTAPATLLHPLLHSNTSDLSEQRYTSTFLGEEFFLADHQVENQKVLPAVAYLEMARAAVERSVPARPEAAVLELRDTVWAQPIVVTGERQISIALLANDDDQPDYEIYSEEPIVRTRGRRPSIARAGGLQPSTCAGQARLAQLQARMTEADWGPTVFTRPVPHGPRLWSSV
jgi:polyketide synthase PksN